MSRIIDKILDRLMVGLVSVSLLMLICYRPDLWK